MVRGPFELPLDHDFSGSGVYAIFYQGSSKIYEAVRSLDSAKPIYVGKAVPPGSRKGGKQLSSARPLYSRLMEHSKSIQNAPSLEISHFRCRYLVVTPLWITMAERFLIEHYKPVWNLCIEGFGNHDPGSGRAQGALSWWDALHPGRAWAKKLRQSRTSAEAKQRLKSFIASPPTNVVFTDSDAEDSGE